MLRSLGCRLKLFRFNDIVAVLNLGASVIRISFAFRYSIFGFTALDIVQKALYHVNLVDPVKF